MLVENTGERGRELKSDKGNRASYTCVYEYGNNSEGPTCNYVMFILGGPSQCTLIHYAAQAGRGNAIFNLVYGILQNGNGSRGVGFCLLKV